jgi:hypothetical protein
MKMGLSFENDTLEKMLTQIFKLIPDSTVSNTFLLSIKHTDVQQAFDHISSVLKPQQ